MAKAYLFRRKLGFPLPRGGTAGHVGWAFTLQNGQILCGSTENPDSKPWKAIGDDNGFWSKPVPDEETLRAEMRRHRYDDYKEHELKDSDPDLAQAVSENCRSLGYSFSGNNCVDHAYQILCHFGALDLPIPLEAPYPNAWFSATAWHWRNLHADH